MRFFAEFILSELMRFFALLRMTDDVPGIQSKGRDE